MRGAPGGRTGALRIANCSGFFGDRAHAAREMVEGGPIDVLTGDYLAELTMLILWKAQQKDPAAGYARTVLAQHRAGVASRRVLLPRFPQDQHGQLGQVVPGQDVDRAALDHLLGGGGAVAVEAGGVADADGAAR